MKFGTLESKKALEKYKTKNKLEEVSIKVLLSDFNNFDNKEELPDILSLCESEINKIPMTMNCIMQDLGIIY